VQESNFQAQPASVMGFYHQIFCRAGFLRFLRRFFAVGAQIAQNINQFFFLLKKSDFFLSANNIFKSKIQLKPSYEYSSGYFLP